MFFGDDLLTCKSVDAEIKRTEKKEAANLISMSTKCK